MLTQTQQELLKNLEQEFSKLNTPVKSNENRLINKAVFDDNKNQSNKITLELRAVEKATNKAIQEMIENDIERLNNDLKEMGLIAIRSEWDKGYTLYIDTMYNVTHKNKTELSISFTYLRKGCSQTLPNGTSIYYVNKFDHISIYLNPYGMSNNFATIDELCADSIFNRKIEKLYNSLSK